MLDIKFIRNNLDEVKIAMKNRNEDMDRTIDELIDLDAQRRNITASVEQMKAKQNSVTKNIPVLKKKGEDISSLMLEMKELSDKITDLNTKLSSIEDCQRDILLKIPNIPNKSVPIGKDDSDNVEIRRWGTPRKFEFEPKAHWDLGKNLGILDPERAAKVTGKRFHFYRGLGARLERAIINFYLNTHTANGYTEVLPPFIVNRESMTGTGQLPKFEDDAFKLSNQEFFLIPTAEVPVTNMQRD